MFGSPKGMSQALSLVPFGQINSPEESVSFQLIVNRMGDLLGYLLLVNLG